MLKPTPDKIEDHSRPLCMQWIIDYTPHLNLQPVVEFEFINLELADPLKQNGTKAEKRA